MPTVQIERRRRGIFGWIVAILFWAWQLFMAAWLIGGVNSASTVSSTARSEAERAGANIGIGIGVTMVLVLWVLGTVILGFMMMFTRGRRELITMERPDVPHTQDEIEMGRPRKPDAKTVAERVAASLTTRGVRRVGLDRDALAAVEALRVHFGLATATETVKHVLLDAAARVA